MIAALSITVAALLLQQCLSKQAIARPAFSCYLIGYLFCCFAYDATSRDTWIYWASIQAVFCAVTLAESFWKDWGQAERRWWGAVASIGVGLFVAIVVTELEDKFGSDIKWATIRVSFWSTAWLTSYLAARRFAKTSRFDVLLLCWLSMDPVQNLAFWFTGSDPTGLGTLLHQRLAVLWAIMRIGILAAWTVSEEMERRQRSVRQTLRTQSASG